MKGRFYRQGACRYGFYEPSSSENPLVVVVVALGDKHWKKAPKDVHLHYAARPREDERMAGILVVGACLPRAMAIVSHIFARQDE